MDSYIKETQKRYREAQKRYNDIKDKIEKLQQEVITLGGKLDAYSRILKDELGNEGFRKLDEEIRSASNSEQSKVRIDSSPNPPSITNAILAAVEGKGSEGITTSEVINKLEEFGFGPEKRNTIYGILSRLKTTKRIRKAGNQFFVG